MRNLILVLLFLLIITPHKAQTPAYDMAQQMGRGINLGNTLEPEYEATWNNDSVQEYYFDMYKEAGFKTIRIPIRWDKHTSSDTPYAIDEQWINRVEQVVDWALERDLIVIINAHHEQWFKADYTNQKDRMDSIWSQVSTQFKDKSHQLCFELLNEPTVDGTTGLTQDQLDEFNKRTLGIIRKTNPYRIVIYAGMGWSSAEDLKNAAIPDYNDSCIMATYHSYNPWSFAGLGTGTWGTEAQQTQMENEFIAMKIWSDQHNIPVVLSEFGAINTSDYNSRQFHYHKNIAYASKYSIATIAWDDGGDFEIMQRNDTSWNDLKDILIYSSDSAITNITTEALSDTAIAISWQTDTSTNSQYQLQRKLLNTDFNTIAQVNDTTYFIDTTAQTDQFYYYRIVQINDRDTTPSYLQRNMLMSQTRSPYEGIPYTIPGEIEAENFDIGREGLCYHDTDEENIPGAYRTSTGVDIEAREDTLYHLAYLATGEWVEYTIDVIEYGNYIFTAYVASQQSGGQLQISCGNLASSVGTVDATGSWTSFVPVTMQMELFEGEQQLRITILNNIPFNIDKINVTEATNINKKNAPNYLIYPNPTKDEIWVTGASYPLNLSIYTNEGTLALQCQVNNEKQKVNIEELPRGVYLLNIQNSDVTLSEQLIKH